MHNYKEAIRNAVKQLTDLGCFVSFGCHDNWVTTLVITPIRPGIGRPDHYRHSVLKDALMYRKIRDELLGVVGAVKAEEKLAEENS